MINSIKIKPLGTVSPFCTKNHNCPGFLIQYKDYNILLDCGNGITRLLDFPEILTNLHIFISHNHKDHYGDLSAIQHASYVYHKLGFITDKINIYYNKDYFNNMELVESFANYHYIKESTTYKFDDLTISFYNNMSHSVTSYVFILTTPSFKIVYTGDVGNNNFKQLIDKCKNADVLICESSLLLEHNISTSTHLTAFEAGMLAKKSLVKQLILTHFFPTENRVKYLSEAQSLFPTTILAEEGNVYILKKLSNDSFI